MVMGMRNIDTLRSFNTLKAHGMTEDTAEALVEIIKKEDISELTAGMCLMQRLFFGGTLTILLAIAALFFHS